MSTARRFYVVWEDGRRDIVEGEDSPAALTVAQRRGPVQSITSDPARVSGFGQPTGRIA
jgi:hypothetical protein